MLPPAKFARLLSKLPPAGVPGLFDAFAGEHPTHVRVSAVEDLLRAGGQEWRNEVGIWIADLLAVDQLVPAAYKRWRPLVHHSMAFVASHISDARLAPKIVEQFELPPDTPAEVRVGKLIARTPGLQKLGQVLARARGLSPSLRKELQKLENGIADVSAGEVRSLVVHQLDRCIDAYRVELASDLLSEASVSAILEFTWLNPTTGKREEGVFKVMKPHVPSCYAEDLWLLQQLAADLAVRTREYYFASRQVTETLDEVRLLLEREVDFRREQATLAEVGRVYRGGGAHAPKPIPQLCTDTITAMSVERGVKVTDAFRRSPLARRRIATQIVQSLLANPVFSSEESAVFHADPHAGNLLYNERKRELIVLDWALTGRLSREERRQAARMIVMMAFRDSGGVRCAIQALSRSWAGQPQGSAEIIDRCVNDFFGKLPHACSLGAIDAMRLLDRIAAEGVRLPTSLLLMRKVIFTLDGVLADIAGGEIRIDAIIAGEFVSRWLKQFGRFPAPFSLADYLAMQRSAFLYATGLWSWTA
jgi:ubiquinone biosynthesis protein